MKYPPVQYPSYLDLEKLLDCQHPLSRTYQQEVHDETLFIIVHQSYELWFKQIVHELDSVMEVFDSKSISDQEMFLAVNRLNRIKKIQTLFLPHLEILETMSPMDFLEFRDMLIPASGFQSFQFRQIENKLGLKDRHHFDQIPYTERLSKTEQEKIKTDKRSLFDLIESWLERTPFLRHQDFEFWTSYKEAVETLLTQEEQIVLSNTTLSPNHRDKQLKNIINTRLNFQSIMDEKKYEELRLSGHRRLSFRATHASLLIFLYRDVPVFHLPYQLLNSLIEIDENFTSWRARHALMVQRMIGMKIGTGGSSGHDYLKQTTEKHQIFTDFMNLSTYLIPRKMLPKLPDSLIEKMNFGYSTND